MGLAKASTESSVLATVLRSTRVARAAVAGLTLGLSALAGLALWSATSTAETTAFIRSTDQVSEYWGKAFLSLSLEGEALNNYVVADSDIGRGPLTTAVGSATASLDWLVVNGSAKDRAGAHSARENYRSYSDMLTEFIEVGTNRDRQQVALDAEPVSLAASSLQKQAVAHMTRKRLENKEYMSRVEADSQRIKFAAVVLGIVDLMLLAFCAMVLVSHQRRIERQAVRDGLTGLANRALLGDRMDQALRTADRSGEPVGLLLLDLNRFKEINDTLGHHAGDLLLQQVADRIGGAVRGGDTVARLGGDEFAVLLPQMGSVQQVEDIAERVLAAIQVPADLDGTVVDVRASIGAAVYPVHTSSAAELIQHADAAMYQAKRGQLGTALYQPPGERPEVSVPDLLDGLHRALQENELVLHYQPKARTDSSRVCGVEALVRWQHPQRGLLPPAEFIPVAESSDLIHPLTDYVLAAALRQHRAWERDGLLLPVSVNITAHSLLDKGFPGRLAALLAQHDTAPDQLTLELTETAAITDSGRARAVLGRLRELGVRISIDDFGAGYSSMAYLHDLPLDELKIDRQFIMSAVSAPGDAAIIRAILALARALDLDVVAEGVEDGPTLQALDEMGCSVAQGYYLCRPMPADALARWLTQQPGRLHVAAPAA